MRPLIQFREHEGPLIPKPSPLCAHRCGRPYEISSGIFPTLRLLLYGKGEVSSRKKKIERLRYILENQGYTAIGDLWTPGSSLSLLSRPGDHLGGIHRVLGGHAGVIAGGGLEASASGALVDRLCRSKAQTGVGAELVLAADQFVVTPAGRLPDATRAMQQETRCAP